MKPRSFTIKGHEYTVLPFDGIEGQPIFFELLAMGAEPLLKALSAMDSGDEDQKKAISLMAGDIAGSLRSLAERPETFRKLFKNATRDGLALSGDGAYRGAYGANWGEMLLAAKQIIEVNGFLDFIGDLSELKE